MSVLVACLLIIGVSPVNELGLVKLKGITWNHTRGFLPMVATAQRFSELYPHVEITWEKRSLQAFGDQPIEQLATHYDLLVIDHPFVGYAAANPVLLALNELLPVSFLEDQARHSVGRSYESYSYGGYLWALAIDAATPVSAWRPDRLALTPETWDELLMLAREGRVIVPGMPIDSLMNFYMLCIALGEEPFTCDNQLVSAGVGVAALEELRALLQLCDPICFDRDPIRTYEALLADEQAAYCPFVYGYSNYARPGYAAQLLRFGRLVRYRGVPLRSTLGGTGLAISRSCRHPEVAAAYTQYVATAETQCGLYLQAGGQPGYRTVWKHEAADAVSTYFRDTLPTLDDAFLRPRYDGYLYFQDHAAPLVHRFLRDGGNPHHVMAELNTLNRESRCS
jgi:multiple sugar transport system substrate-binding protein